MEKDTAMDVSNENIVTSNNNSTNSTNITATITTSTTTIATETNSTSTAITEENHDTKKETIQQTLPVVRVPVKHANLGIRSHAMYVN